MPRYKDKCDDCGGMANIAMPDGPAYCDKDARKRGSEMFGGYTLIDLLDLSWWQRIIKYDLTGRWIEIFKKAGYTA